MIRLVMPQTKMKVRKIQAIKVLESRVYMETNVLICQIEILIPWSRELSHKVSISTRITQLK